MHNGLRDHCIGITLRGESEQWSEDSLCQLSFSGWFVILLQVSRTDSFAEEAFSCPDDREISLDEFLRRRTVMYLSSLPKTLLCQSDFTVFGKQCHTKFL